MRSTVVIPAIRTRPSASILPPNPASAGTEHTDLTQLGHPLGKPLPVSEPVPRDLGQGRQVDCHVEAKRGGQSDYPLRLSRPSRFALRSARPKSQMAAGISSAPMSSNKP